MDKKQRLFIYGRREVGILFLLGVTVAVFAFTLGVHLGKKVGLDLPTSESPNSSASVVPTVDDKTPSNQELTEQGKGANQAAEETMNQELHDEVARRGIRLDAPKQVELPEKTKSKEAGATTLAPQSETTQPKPHASESHEAAEPAKPAEESAEHPAESAEEKAPAESEAEPVKQRGKTKSLHAAPPAGGGKYTIQVGSFPSVAEAQVEADHLEKSGLKPFLRPAEVKGLGKRYRVYVGSYATREEAQKAGQKYKSQNRFGSFIVGKLPSAE